MIGEGPNRVFGVGQYLRNLVTSLAELDSSTEYVLWSSSLKYRVPAWYLAFVEQNRNFRAVHMRVPNQLLDRAALSTRLSFLSFLIGRVDVSYEANYFPLAPGGAYSICTVHDLSFLDRDLGRSLGWQERAAMMAGAADKITTVSQASRDRIIKQIPGVRPDDVVVIHGAAQQSFAPGYADERSSSVADRYALPRRYFIFAGEPVPRKNLPVLVRAFHVARRSCPDIHLLMAGFDPARLPDCLRGCDLEHVRALGYVDREDLPSLYRASQALVYPSLDEGFGLPVVEAMSTGQIAIASDLAVFSEIAGPGAVLARPDEPCLAEAMLMVLALTPEDRTTRIAAALRAAERFSWSTSALRLQQLFEEGFSKRSRR